MRICGQRDLASFGVVEGERIETPWGRTATVCGLRWYTRYVNGEPEDVRRVVFELDRSLRLGKPGDTKTFWDTWETAEDFERLGFKRLPT